MNLTIDDKSKYKTGYISVSQCNYNGPKIFNVPEEKRTDVNIAVHMMIDAIENKCDRFVIVSGDSDLFPAVRAVKSLSLDKKIIVYTPAHNDAGSMYWFISSAARP